MMRKLLSPLPVFLKRTMRKGNLVRAMCGNRSPSDVGKIRNVNLLRMMRRSDEKAIKTRGDLVRSMSEWNRSPSDVVKIRNVHLLRMMMSR